MAQVIGEGVDSEGTLKWIPSDKRPQLPFFPIMAPEANVLKRKQKNCFTSHKQARDTVGGRGTGVRQAHQNC